MTSLIYPPRPLFLRVSKVLGVSETEKKKRPHARPLFSVSGNLFFLEEQAGNKQRHGRQEPFNSPDLYGLPIQPGGGGKEESGEQRGDYTYAAQNKGQQ